MYFTFCARLQLILHLSSYCVLLHGKKKLLLCSTEFLHRSQEVTLLLLHVLLLQLGAKLCSVQKSRTEMQMRLKKINCLSHTENHMTLSVTRPKSFYRQYEQVESCHREIVDKFFILHLRSE